MTHTQGDWDYTIGDVEKRSMSSIFKKGDPEWMIANVVCESHNPLQREEDISNLKLLWAAPKLLAACQAALDYLLANVPKGNIRDSRHFQALNEHANGVCKPLRAAIAAATGEEAP